MEGRFMGEDWSCFGEGAQLLLWRFCTCTRSWPWWIAWFGGFVTLRCALTVSHHGYLLYHTIMRCLHYVTYFSDQSTSSSAASMASLQCLCLQLSQLGCVVMLRLLSCGLCIHLGSYLRVTAVGVIMHPQICYAFTTTINQHNGDPDPLPEAASSASPEEAPSRQRWDSRSDRQRRAIDAIISPHHASKANAEHRGRRWACLHRGGAGVAHLGWRWP